MFRHWFESPCSIVYKIRKVLSLRQSYSSNYCRVETGEASNNTDIMYILFPHLHYGFRQSTPCTPPRLILMLLVALYTQIAMLYHQFRNLPHTLLCRDLICQSSCLNTDARTRPQASPRGIRKRKSDTGAVFSTRTFVFHCQHHSTSDQSSFIYWRLYNPGSRPYRQIKHFFLYK